MKLKALVGMAGGINLKPGDVFDAPGDEAKRLIDAGYAVPEISDVTERAVASSAPESRTARKAKR